MDHGIPAPGYRLPASTKVGRVRLQIADLERSFDYYTRVLGLRELESSGGSIVLGPAGRPRPLVELIEKPGVDPVPPRGRPGLYHFALLLPDRRQLGAFIRHLAEVGERAGASDHRVSEAVYLQDPDGLGIEVYADRPRDEWRHRDGQLVMATDPLDIPGLVQAAAGSDWSGMPTGTTIGHIHLHVGDLAAASAFYHDALGLDRMVWSYPGALFLAAGGYHHHLGLNTWAAARPPAGEDDARLLEWELLVPTAGDAEDAGASMAAAGHPVKRSRSSVRTEDPWGTRLHIRPLQHEEEP